MKSHVRFYVIIAVVIVAVTGLWILLRNTSPGPNDATSQSHRPVPNSTAPVTQPTANPTPPDTASGLAGKEVGNESVVLTLTQGGDLTGRVVYAGSNEPAPDIDVVCESDIARESQKDRTDADGKFSFSNLRETTFNLRIDNPKLILTKAPDPVAIVAGQSTTVPDLEIASGGAITGRVYDIKTNIGITGAQLYVQAESVAEGGYSPSRGKEVVTGSDGAYTAEGLPPGQYLMNMREAKGYPPPRDSDWKRVSVVMGNTITGIDFALDAGLLASGIVVDVEGNPLNAASVSTHSRQLGVLQKTSSDESGEFTLYGLQQGSGYTFTAKKNGFSAKPIGPMEIPAEGLRDMRIVLYAESTISGIVVDASGNRVPNAHVCAWPAPPAGDGSPFPEGSCDAYGQFTINGMHEGSYRLQAHGDASVASESDDTIPIVEIAQGESKTGVTVVLNDEGSLEISGTVTNSKGEPLRDVFINTWPISSSNVPTGVDGTFTLKNLTEGKYDLSVGSREYTPQEVPDIDAGTTGLTIVLKGLGAIDGSVVTNSGQPVTDFEIIWVRQQGINYPSKGQGKRVQNPEGHFQLADVPVGDTSFLVRAPGFSPSIQNVPDVREGETTSDVVVRLEPGGAVSGRVLDQTGIPVAGASIYEGAAPARSYDRYGNARSKSDSDGAFTIEGLPVGNVTLAAAAPGFVASSIDVQTSAGQTTNADIVLGGGATVRVTIRAQGFKPESRWAGLFNSIHGLAMDGQVDESGVIEFKAVAAGEYGVNASVSVRNANGIQSDRSQDRSITVTEGQTIEVEFEFEQASATLTGSVLKDGTPLTNSKISVRTGEASDEQAEFGYAQTDANGQFIIVGLPAGPARVFVNAVLRSDQPVSRQVNIVLKNNQTTEVNVDFADGAKISGTVSGIENAVTCYITVIKGHISIPTKPDAAFYLDLDQQGLMLGGAQVDKATGEYIIEALEAGDYTIRVSAKDTDPGANPEEVNTNIRSTSGTISVNENETATLDLALP